jgi:4,5-dihydroxyphthalate decarboxylase
LRLLSFPVEEIFYRFIVYREWEVSEISMAKYCAMIAAGDESFWALPVFPSRVFRHSSLYVRRDGPIKSIGDLKGRSIGIPEWAQTAAVYSRGFLVQQYGLDLASIQWVQAGVNQPGRVEKVDLALPKGVTVERRADKSLNGMLLSGEVDAVLAARPPDAFIEGHSDIRRFFDDYLEVEQDYYKKTGIFPIMHTVAVRRDVLDANPWVARNLFQAFDEARRRSIVRALDNTVSLYPIPWGFEYARRGKELMGTDYFPYGIEPNRKTLEAFLRFAYEQGVCKRLLKVEDLFPKQMHSTHKV